ncbi:MAG TPA: patatin-like phospholipase family protein, partial [Chloroflexota bacterium]|nr:patatin-like phospholipase family protein [Chloroflexota bacterium]
MPVAVALSGGGARGAAQVGVLRAFDEFGIRPDMVLGASAGAVNGAWYALRPGRLDDLAGVWLGLSKRGVFPGTPAHYAYNLARHGHVHRIESWAGILRKSFHDALIEEAVLPLTVLTVRLADGKVMTHDAGPLVPALMASTAAPGVFPPQRLGGELHVDGAVVEFLPIPTAVRQGA